MAVASIRVSSVQLTDFVWRDFGFYSGAAAAARADAKASQRYRLTREERRRTALIRGLRFYLTKAGLEGLFLLHCFRSVVCLLACLFITFVHCAQTAEDIDTISFVYDSPMPLPDCLKIWPISANQVLSTVCPKVTHPC